MNNELTTVTDLSSIDKCISDCITDDTLLLVECKQQGDGLSTYTGYETKSITYRDLKKNVRKGMGLEILSIYVDEILNGLYVPTTDISLKSNPKDIYVISALCNTRRGVTTALSTYSLFRTTSDIFNKKEFDNISAENSPWVNLDSITNDITDGNSETNVASQKSLSSLSSEVIEKYINKDSIVDIIDDDEYKVTSQKLVSDLSTHINSSYIKNSNIGNSLEYNSNYVANISCIKSLSDDINNNYILNDSITPSFYNIGDKQDKVVSEKVIYEMSSYISGEYAIANHLTKLNNFSTVGESSDKSASQKLMYDLSGAINSHLNGFTEDGKVLYCGKNNTLSSKDVYQDFAVFLNRIDTEQLDDKIKFDKDKSKCEIQLKNLPSYYTIFGDGVIDDKVFKLTATYDTIFENTTSQTREIDLKDLYISLITDNLDLRYFTTAKFNFVPEGTFVYNKKTGKKFYFIDKNFIQF